MTQPQTPPVVELPEMQHPICNRVLANNPYPAADGQPLLWEQGKPHPLIKGLVVLRMYVVPGAGVDVYSVTQPQDGKPAAVTGGLRNTLPWMTLRLVEELMDVPTFVEEIAAAEDSGEPEPAPAPAAAAAPARIPVVVQTNGGA